MKFKCIILTMLLTLILSQRGGGGGGGGRGGGGGGGGRGIFGAQGAQCKNKCNQNHKTQPQLQKCLESCPSVGGFFSGLFVTVGAMCCCSYWCSKKEPPNRQQVILSIKKRYQNLSKQFMSENSFKDRREKFRDQNWNFSFTQSGMTHECQNVRFKLTFKEPFGCEIKGLGHDYFGRWEFKGMWFCSDTGIKLWMIKDYENKQQAGHTGRFGQLIYEGEETQLNTYSGRWYFQGFESNAQYSGTWRMNGLVNISDNVQTQHQINQQLCNELKQRLF